MTNVKELPKEGSSEFSVMCGQVEAPKFRTISLVDAKGEVKSPWNVYLEAREQAAFFLRDGKLVVAIPPIDKGGKDEVSTAQEYDIRQQLLRLGHLYLHDHQPLDGPITEQTIADAYGGRTSEDLRRSFYREQKNLRKAQWMVIPQITDEQREEDARKIQKVSSFGQAARTANISQYQESVNYAPTVTLTLAGGMTVMGLVGCVPVDIPVSSIEKTAMPTATAEPRLVSPGRLDSMADGADKVRVSSSLEKIGADCASRVEGFVEGSQQIIEFSYEGKLYQWKFCNAIDPADGVKKTKVVGYEELTSTGSSLSSREWNNFLVMQTAEDGSNVYGIVEGDKSYGVLVFVSKSLEGFYTVDGEYHQVKEDINNIFAEKGFFDPPIVVKAEAPTEIPTEVTDPTAIPETPEVVVNYENIADVPLENRLYLRSSEYTVNETNLPLGTGMVDFPDSRVEDFYEKMSRDIFGDSGLKLGWFSGILMGTVKVDNESGNMTIPMGVENSAGELVTVNVIYHIGNDSEVYTGGVFDFVPKRGLGAYPGYDLQGSMRGQIFDIIDIPNNLVVGKQIILVIPNYISQEQAGTGYEYTVNEYCKGLPSNANIIIAMRYAEENMVEAMKVLGLIEEGTGVEGELELRTYVSQFKVPELE